MKKQNQLNSSEIEIQSLSNEISNKSVIIARLNAQLYKLASENEKLKKKTKTKNGSKK